MNIKNVQILVMIALAAMTPTLQAAIAPEGKVYQGIYCLTYLQTSPHGFPLNGPLWQADSISGVALRVTWSAIQPSKGAYDWSMFDKSLALAVQNNKKISLSVSTGAVSQPWLVAEGAATINIVPETNGQPVRANVVLPWDPIFLKEWSAFVEAEGARYDNNPNVGYVSIGGPGTGISTVAVRNQQDYDTFNAAGGLTKWVEGSKAIIDMYGAAFKSTPFILVLANPVLNVPSAKAAGQAALQQVINYGMAKYPGRFGVGGDTLSANSLNQASSDYFISQIILQNSAASPTGFQMIGAATSSTSTTGSVGNLGTATMAGMQMGAQFIEVYQADCENAQYTAMLKAANEQLNGN
jgi:hypothetical protein